MRPGFRVGTRAHLLRTAERQMDVLNAGTAIRAGVSLSELSLNDVWLRYLELTGTHTLKEFHAYVYDDAVWSAHEHNVAAQALNDYFVDHGLDHLVAYAHEL
jgi:hypothetical protein